MAEVIYDGRRVSTDTNLGKEVAKWNKPYVYEEYPKMLFKAAMSPSGQVRVSEVRPNMAIGSWKPDELQREYDRCDFFDRANQRTVNNEEEHKEALNQGWRNHPKEALEHYEERQRKIGNAAAERAAQDVKMSEKAQAEAAAADAETEFHLPEIPVKRRGRPRKVA